MTALLLVLTALLIALNAFFVMGEYALVRSRRARLETMRDEGLRGAARRRATPSARSIAYSFGTISPAMMCALVMMR